MKLNFIKNIDFDIENWQRSIEIRSYGVDWNKYIPTDLSIKCVKTRECLIDYLKKHYYDRLIDAYLEKLKNKINISEIQSDLEFLMNKKFPDKIEINIFITTFIRAPYNVGNNYFYVRYYSDKDGVKKSIMNIYHELMHFLFHWNYWQKCQYSGLKENQIHDIKESFTVLLNSVLAKRNLPLDKGYKDHQRLRDRIIKLWQKNRDFKFVLKEIIKIKQTLDK